VRAAGLLYGVADKIIEEAYNTGKLPPYRIDSETGRKRRGRALGNKVSISRGPVFAHAR
jgi:hypothetical protein